MKLIEQKPVSAGGKLSTDNMQLVNSTVAVLQEIGIDIDKFNENNITGIKTDIISCSNTTNTFEEYISGKYNKIKNLVVYAIGSNLGIDAENIKIICQYFGYQGLYQKPLYKDDGLSFNDDLIKLFKCESSNIGGTIIASQGPIKVTVDHFKQMLYEQNVSRIIMVTNLQEAGVSKCEDYVSIEKSSGIVLSLSKLEADVGNSVSYILSNLTLLKTSKENVSPFTSDFISLEIIPRPRPRRLELVNAVIPSHNASQNVQSSLPTHVHFSELLDPGIRKLNEKKQKIDAQNAPPRPEKSKNFMTPLQRQIDAQNAPPKPPRTKLSTQQQTQNAKQKVKTTTKPTLSEEQKLTQYRRMQKKLVNDRTLAQQFENLNVSSIKNEHSIKPSNEPSIKPSNEPSNEPSPFKRRTRTTRTKKPRTNSKAKSSNPFLQNSTSNSNETNESSYNPFL
jgi:hypothetical protein